MVIRENKYFIYDKPVNVNIKYIIKSILYVFLTVFYKLLIFFNISKKDTEKKYKVAICAIFRDEASILREWIEYHKIVGVEHFYLYNNLSADDYLEILTPYINDGLVTLIDWPEERAQMKAYADCVDKYKNETHWIGFIDLDEFIVPNGQNKSVYDFLRKYSNKAPFVIVYWKYFGSSGLLNRDENSLVTESFTHCWYKYANMGKYFYNTKFNYDAKEKLQTGYMHHRWGSLKGISIPPINEFGKFCIFGLNKAGTYDFPIQINHYVIKTYDEYKEKKSKRGGGVHKIQPGFHDLTYFFDHEEMCQDVDYKISRFAIKLKLNLQK